MVADQTPSQFVARVSSLPTVEAAVGIAVTSYNKLKDASPGPIKAVIEAGEKTTSAAIASSQPILNKLQGPIQFVDSIACQGLDRVEQSVPSVKDAPEKIYSDVKQYGNDKVISVRDSVVGFGNQRLEQFGLGMVKPERLNEYREQLVAYATTALQAAEGALDSHLTSSGVESKSTGHENITEMVTSISAKARLCVTHHTTSKFVAAQKYASDGVGRVGEALQVIMALKNSVKDGKTVQEISKDLKFEWLAKLLQEAQDKPATQQAIYVAQAAAREAQEALGKVSGEVKSKVNDAYGAVLSRVNELNTGLSNLSVSDVSSSVVSTLHEQATNLQKLIQQFTGLNLTQYLPELPAAEKVAQE